MEKIDLFVPGRLCLIGEHSDWAGINRMMNAEVVPGMAIVTGINQGIYASIEKSDKFIVESDLSYYNGERFECEMDTEKLRETASNGGFFSYVAGVASYINEHYRVKGKLLRWIFLLRVDYLVVQLYVFSLQGHLISIITCILILLVR